MKRPKFSEKNLKIVAEMPAEARKAKFWKRVLNLLSSPSRSKKGVNLSKISEYAKEGSVVVVPDKVLGTGRLTKKIAIAAASFSASAKKAIEEAGGKILSIAQAAKQSPSGKDHVIIK
ncbi:MAG: 50S ribosomal protein L18e [Candidatus Anstonellaceae archaeon]